MADIEIAKKAAETVMEHMREAERMAVPGTHAHWQFVSARLMQEWPRIQTALEIILKT